MLKVTSNEEEKKSKKFWEVFLGGKTIFLGLQIWGDFVHVQCHS